MPELKPRQIPLSEYMLISSAELQELGGWIANVAIPRVVEHGHSTSRHGASRGMSILRKAGVLYTTPPPPDKIKDIVGRMYDALLEPTADYLGVKLGKLVSRHTAVAHLYLPGDPATEGHVDLLPTVPVYVTGPLDSGFLHVSRRPKASSIEEILEDADRIPPTPATFALFDGRNYPHVVEGLPVDAAQCRTSVNLTYVPIDGLGGVDPTHPRYPGDRS